MQRNSDDALTRQHAMQQFEQLGYTIVDGSQEENGDCSATGRRHIGEVLLLSQLRHALSTLNPDCPPNLIDKAMQTFTEGLSLYSIAQANRQIHALLIDGIKLDQQGQVVTPDIEERREGVHQGGDHPIQDTTHQGGYQMEGGKPLPYETQTPAAHKTLRVIDWREPEQNTFTVVSHLWINGKLGKRCLDLVGFVNGLPFILLEIAEGELRHTFDRIDQDYKTTIPAFFWYNAFIIVANTFTCKMGSFTTPWEHFFQWKRVHDENEPENIRLATLLEGTCQKTRLLDIVENFTLFDTGKGLKKLVARNHQYLGVNNAIASLCAWEKERAERKAMRHTAGQPEPTKEHGKLGVFWHTQGSGKSYSMVFFVRKVQRTIRNDYTFVVITDREDLDKQIFDNFSHTDSIQEDEKEIHARNAEQLQRLLGENHLLLFTLIQKFYSEQPGQDYRKLSDSEKIIILTDEAHRTQYDTLAKNIRDALPKAAFLGFTGTPLMDGEEQTRETFGKYVSIYNFRRAINDGTTVPLYYENRTPEVEMINPNFDEEMVELLEEAELDDRQEQRIYEQYARAGNIFTKGERLDQVARSIVQHFMRRGYDYMGKALVISIDKITAIRTRNRVEEQWRSYREELRQRLEQEHDPDIQRELQDKITYMDQTQMAVVVSATEGDSKRFAAFASETGEQIEIAHQTQASNEQLAKNFKSEEHPLRIAFVCAMWITGFDVPPLSTIYLDRPLKGHTLMQTIARANRVHRDKLNGLIVDYASTMRRLEQALAIYAREDSSINALKDKPIGNKSDLVQMLRTLLAEAEQFFAAHDIDIPHLLQQLANMPDRLQQENLLQGTIDVLVAGDDIKLNTLLLTGEIDKLYRAILPDAAERDFTQPVYLYRLLKSGIYNTMQPGGIDYTLGLAKTLVRASLEVREHEPRYSPETNQLRGSFDLRDIDLDTLRTNMRSGQRHIKAEQMRQMMYERIKRMLQVNPKRTGLMEKLDRAIARYNEGSANVAVDPQLINGDEKITRLAELQNDYADELVDIVEDVQQEEERHIREGVSEQTLAVFDLLTSGVELDEEQRSQVKEIAQRIYIKLQHIFIVPDWQNKGKGNILSQAYIIIEDALLNLPQQIYAQDLYKQKCDDIFLHIQTHNTGSETIDVA
jgi:type I restriction enzyme, R subunit